MAPIEAEAIPLPNEDTTPPVMKMYRVMCDESLSMNQFSVRCLEQQPALRMRQW